MAIESSQWVSLSIHNDLWRQVAMQVPSMFIGARKDVRHRIRRILRATNRAEDVLLLIEEHGMSEVKPEQRIRFEAPIDRSPIAVEGEVWLCELHEMAFISRTPLDYEELVIALGARAWGALALMEIGQYRVWPIYWDRVRSQLPTIYNSDATFINRFGQKGKQLHTVSWGLWQMMIWSRRVVPGVFEEPFTADTFLPEFADTQINKG